MDLIITNPSFGLFYRAAVPPKPCELAWAVTIKSGQWAEFCCFTVILAILHLHELHAQFPVCVVDFPGPEDGMCLVFAKE